LSRFSLDPPAGVREELVGAWYPLTPWPEANGLLAALAGKDYPLAILSNGDQDMLEALAARFDTPFQHIFSSEQCGMYKPHPSVYALPGKVAGVENYLHVAGSANDVVGAKAAGIACYWSNRQGDRVPLPDCEPDHQGADLTALLEIV
jgi:2-haloacid dehalogenase